MQTSWPRFQPPFQQSVPRGTLFTTNMLPSGGEAGNSWARPVTRTRCLSNSQSPTLARTFHVEHSRAQGCADLLRCGKLPVVLPLISTFIGSYVPRGTFCDWVL